MMVQTIREQIPGELYYHKLTVCRGYKEFGLKGSWKPYGYSIALDLGGDTFTLYYGLKQFLRHCLHLLIMVLFGQPYALFSQTLSPYGKVTGKIAKFFLERAEFITVRDEPSYKLLESFGILSTLTHDITFLLKNPIPGIPKNYDGSSYHRLIHAFMFGEWFKWNGKRAHNWKFTFFSKLKEFTPNEMNIGAKRNFEELHRFLKNRAF